MMVYFAFIKWVFQITSQKKKKIKTDTTANENLAVTPKLIAKTNGHSTSTTPAQSSEDSCSDSDKEMVRPPVDLPNFKGVACDLGKLGHAKLLYKSKYPCIIFGILLKL